MWIEITTKTSYPFSERSRLARALWIEIDGTVLTTYSLRRRRSREPCGLKFSPHSRDKNLTMSRLVRALRIEIINSSGTTIRKSVEARESLMDLNFTGGIYFFIDLVNKIA